MGESTVSILPRSRVITVSRADGPADVTVRPFRIFGDMQALSSVLPKLQPFMNGLAGGDFVGALSEAGEPCLQLVMMATRLEAEAIVELEADDQLALLVAAFEVNVDFFARRLGPALLNVVSQLVPTEPTGPGAAPSFQDMTSPTPAEAETTTPTPGPTSQAA